MKFLIQIPKKHNKPIFSTLLMKLHVNMHSAINDIGNTRTVITINCPTSKPCDCMEFLFRNSEFGQVGFVCEAAKNTRVRS